MAGAIEGKERHQQNVRLDFRCFGRRLANAPNAGGQWLAPLPAAHDQGLAAAGDGRKRQAGAGIGELAHQRQRIDLAFERHEAGHNGARRDGKGKVARCDCFRRRLAPIRRQRVATRLRGAPQFSFFLGERASTFFPYGASHLDATKRGKCALCHAKKLCGAAPAVGALDPGFPTKVGGRHMSEPTSPVRDSSLKDR